MEDVPLLRLVKHQPYRVPTRVTAIIVRAAIAATLGLTLAVVADSSASAASYTYIPYCNSCYLNQGQYANSSNGGLG